MKCLFYFRDKSKSKKSKSGPELETQNKSDVSSASRTTKSAGSLPSPRSIPELYREKGQDLRVFTYSELREATNGFNRLLKIGEGGFGNVYKGTIKPVDGKGDPIVVAIKRLNQLSMQGHKEWLAEIQFLAVVNHSILTSSTLPWKKRLEIILGAAEGLAYLHEGLDIQVIYRDFKSSNVLLDEDFNPKLSDFGLAREGPTGDHTHVSTAVVGTQGYAAPEYIETGHLNVKSDIWSFGVVLYEILTGRRTVERNRPQSEQKLLDWVKQFPADSRKFSMMIDPRLRDQYSLPAARRVAKLATCCLEKNQKDRPTMKEVVESLKLALQESEDGNSSDRSSQSNMASSDKRRDKMGITGASTSKKKTPPMAQPTKRSIVV